jgi:DNA-binding MarR family transcriptional regulator
VTDESSGHAVVASLDQLFRMLRRAMPPDDLSLTAASALRRLEDGGAQRLTELACLEGITQPAMTQLVSRLEKDHLAERLKDASDGRVVLIRITPTGREALRARRAARARALDQLLHALPAADRDAIMAALPALDRLAKIGTPAS